MKKMLFPAMLCLAVVAAPATSLASSSAPAGDETYSFVTEGGKTVLFDKKNKMYVSEAYNALGEKISLTEYKEAMDKSNEPYKTSREGVRTYDVMSDMGIGTEYFTIDMSYYEEDLSWSTTHTARKATPTVSCNAAAPEPCKIMVQNSLTDTDSFSVGIDFGDEKYVRAGAGFTWETSSQSTVGIEMSIPQGKSGYITWAPWYNHTRGYIHYAYSDDYGYWDLGQSDMVFAQSPRTLYNGHTDGIWAIVYY